MVKRVNSNRQMIIANGRIITEDIIELKYNATTQKYEITFKNQKTYSYNPKNVHWLKEPVVLDPSNYHYRITELRFGIYALSMFLRTSTDAIGTYASKTAPRVTMRKRICK